MAEPIKAQEPKVQEVKPVTIDWKKAEDHLNEVEKEFHALAKDDKGNIKKGVNAYQAVKSVVFPLRKKLADEAQRNESLFKSIMDLKAEEPTVAKFFRHPLK